MTTRILRAWQGLAGQLAHHRPGDAAFFHVLRAWLRNDAPAISKLAAEALRDARGVAQVLEGDPERLAISTHAADAFVASLHGDVPRDPVAFIEHVDRLCWTLVLYVDEHDGCPRCQGELGHWTADDAAFTQCDLLGCCFDATGALVAPPAALRPATRAEVLARDPRAALVTCR